MIVLTLLALWGCTGSAHDTNAALDSDAMLLPHAQVALPRTELGTQILPARAGVDCRVRALVGPDGSVQRVDVLTGGLQCSPSFAQAAQQNVTAWKFSPALRDGAPVASRQELDVRFDRDLLIPDRI